MLFEATEIRVTLRQALRLAQGIEHVEILRVLRYHELTCLFGKFIFFLRSENLLRWTYWKFRATIRFIQIKKNLATKEFSDLKLVYTEEYFNHKETEKREKTAERMDFCKKENFD